MAIGANAAMAADSYLAIGRETTTGTYNTCTAGLDFLSASLKTTIERKTLEEVRNTRTMRKGISLAKKVEGELEFYYYPRMDACNFLLANAMGGTVTDSTVTGETTGGGGLDHTFAIGNIIDQSFASMCFNMRKGSSATGQIFEYNGVKVNELTFTAELEEPLKCNAAVIAIDSTATSNTVDSALDVNTASVMSFVDGRFSVEDTFAGLTSTSFWHVQSMEFKITNNLKSDNESRRIGSNLLNVLPQGMASFELSCQIRFDTTTAFDAMVGASQLAAQFEFSGNTMAGSVAKEGIKFSFPSVYVMDAGDPEIGGPDEVLTSNVTFQVLQDDSSASGYAVQAVVTNDLTTAYS